MEDMLINELSLDGQFKKEEDFELNLRDSLKLFELLNVLNIKLFFSTSIYDRKITNITTFSNYLMTSRSDEARKLRLSLLQNFWNESKMQNDEILYKYNTDNIVNGTSIAEASERKSNLYSFNHTDFLLENIKVQKNEETILVKNYTNINRYIDNNFDDIVNIFWQNIKESFKNNFEWLLQIFAIRQNLSFVNNYSYKNLFEKRVLEVPQSIRNKTFEQISKRLSMSREKANRNESLNDEPIKGTGRNDNVRRFYITKSMGRIHYHEINDIIVFDTLNIQHDEGLN